MRFFEIFWHIRIFWPFLTFIFIFLVNYGFLDFLKTFFRFSGFFLDFFWIFWISRFLFGILNFLNFFVKVTTGHQKLPKLGQKSIISSLFLREGQKKPMAEGRSPPQEIKVGSCSGPYLLVIKISISMLPLLPLHQFICSMLWQWASVILPSCTTGKPGPN